MIGHLRALRKFIKDGDKFVCILEDDVLFHDSFCDVLDTLVDHPLTQLYTMSDCRENYNCRYGIFGTQGYVIRRDYAIEYLNKYDRPLIYWPTDIFKSSESITMYSGGIVLDNPPLIIFDNLTYGVFGDETSHNHQINYNLIPSYKKKL